MSLPPALALQTRALLSPSALLTSPAVAGSSSVPDGGVRQKSGAATTRGTDGLGEWQGVPGKEGRVRKWKER